MPRNKVINPRTGNLINVGGNAWRGLCTAGILNAEDYDNPNVLFRAKTRADALKVKREYLLANADPSINVVIDSTGLNVMKQKAKITFAQYAPILVDVCCEILIDIDKGALVPPEEDSKKDDFFHQAMFDKMLEMGVTDQKNNPGKFRIRPDILPEESV